MNFQPKKVKKGKAKKEELRRKREEEQRLREEQERKEKEERQRQREEQLKKEEEERIKAYEEKTREEQKSYINDLLQRISVLCEENQKKEWEEKRWYDYLYKTRDMDPFELPNINAYITQWNDEGNLEIQEVFHKTQQTLKLIDVIENAGYMYPCVGEKTLKLWCEGISKLKDNILKKLDEASFILLKEANQYLNDKTENMEYSINYELDGGDKHINLCLWANLHRAFRKRGLEIFHFKFHLPSEVVEEDCAIRLLFLDFNHISPGEQALLKETNNVISKTEDGPQFIDQKEYFLTGGILHFDLLAIPKLTVRQKGITYIYREQPVLKRIPYKQPVQLRHLLSHDKKNTIQEIQQSIFEEGEEIKKFDEDVEKVPFASQEELEQLEKDEVKVPSSSTEETDALEGVEKVPSNSGEAMQDSEAEKETDEDLGDVIYLKMKLPNKAIFWETPKPSRLCPENNRFASEGIYDVEYNPENKEVSFKTSQFGTFGFFQRRHLNLSYKTWYFSAGDIPELSLKGQYYSIKIRISSQGCQLLSLNPNNDYIPSKLFNEWLCVEKFIQELQEIGINIHVDDVNSYSQSFLKNRELESNIYDCIALLSNICDFGSIEQNQTVSEEEFILKYRLSNLPKNDDYEQAVVTPKKAENLKLGGNKSEYKNEKIKKFAGNLFFLISEESDEKIVSMIAKHFKTIKNTAALLQHCRCLISF